MRILVVDDDPVFRALARKKLVECGSEIFVAEDGATALAITRSQPLDLVLVDLGLPDVDGFALIEELRQSPHTRYIPLIVVTGREDSEAIDRAFALGSSSFLTKPVNWKLFEHQLVYVLRSSQIEREARQARVRAQAESRIKDQVTSRISHSIRPRIQQMMLNAERISVLTAKLPDSEAIAGHASSLISGAGQLKEELSGMIFLTKAVSGILDLNDERCAVADVFADVTRRILDLSLERGIVLETVLPPFDIHLEVDREKLTQALKHLAVNALRYSPRSTCLTFAAMPLSDGAIHLCVQDEGPGIPPDLLARLLSPLSRVDQDVEAGRLSGLGLAIAKLIAEGHGGSLTIRSALDRGTTAGILLPADRIFTAGQDVAQAANDGDHSQSAGRSRRLA
jgi:signal transduction histidine kinase